MAAKNGKIEVEFHVFRKLKSTGTWVHETSHTDKYSARSDAGSFREDWDTDKVALIPVQHPECTYTLCWIREMLHELNLCSK